MKLRSIIALLLCVAALSFTAAAADPGPTGSLYVYLDPNTINQQLCYIPLDGSGYSVNCPFDTSPEYGMTIGTHTVVASYPNGDSNFYAATSDPLTFEIKDPKQHLVIGITASPNPAKKGQTGTFTITLTPQ